ncbi:hypothetical protein L218DRAFT_1028160 [Marasmius fiardii PR-910]|nr:hypothetical protein L218DRAFT_1028160 [Marasmius fiardii PR-910]
MQAVGQATSLFDKCLAMRAFNEEEYGRFTMSLQRATARAAQIAARVYPDPEDNAYREYLKWGLFLWERLRDTVECHRQVELLTRDLELCVMRISHSRAEYELEVRRASRPQAPGSNLRVYRNELRPDWFKSGFSLLICHTHLHANNLSPMSVNSNPTMHETRTISNPPARRRGVGRPSLLSKSKIEMMEAHGHIYARNHKEYYDIVEQEYVDKFGFELPFYAIPEKDKDYSPQSIDTFPAGPEREAEEDRRKAFRRELRSGNGLLTVERELSNSITRDQKKSSGKCEVYTPKLVPDKVAGGKNWTTEALETLKRGLEEQNQQMEAEREKLNGHSNLEVPESQGYVGKWSMPRRNNWGKQSSASIPIRGDISAFIGPDNMMDRVYREYTRFVYEGKIDTSQSSNAQAAVSTPRLPVEAIVPTDNGTRVQFTASTSEPTRLPSSSSQPSPTDVSFPLVSSSSLGVKHESSQSVQPATSGLPQAGFHPRAGKNSTGPDPTRTSYVASVSSPYSMVFIM